MSGLGKSVLKGLACSLGVILLICTVIGFAELFADISEEILDIASVAILSVAAFAAGYAATQLHRSKGMVQGILCGVGLFMLALLLSLVSSEFEFRDIAVVKAIFCLLFGMVGGVKGVNTKKTGERH